jgi:hypothetical protein
MKMAKEKDFGGIVNLSRMLVSAINEAKEQEIKYLTNSRCKRPSFGNVQYALGRLAEREDMEQPTLEEAEFICRKAW